MVQLLRDLDWLPPQICLIDTDPYCAAIHNLALEENAQIEWAFGDILQLWAQRDNWRSCQILQQLESNHPNLAISSWNDLIHRTRIALADEAELRTKANALLSPATIRFNDVMEDFLAEMVAAQYLHTLGHTEIRRYASSEMTRKFTLI